MEVREKQRRQAIQSQPRFIRQLDVGRTKFYDLMNSDLRFPKRFKLGGKWVYYIDDCNEYIRQCAESTEQPKTLNRSSTPMLETVQLY